MLNIPDSWIKIVDATENFSLESASKRNSVRGPLRCSSPWLSFQKGWSGFYPSRIERYFRNIFPVMAFSSFSANLFLSKVKRCCCPFLECSLWRPPPKSLAKWKRLMMQKSSMKAIFTLKYQARWTGRKKDFLCVLDNLATLIFRPTWKDDFFSFKGSLFDPSLWS